MATVTAAPERSIEQRRLALGRANEIRTRRAHLKRDLKAGRVSMRDLITDPPAYLESAKVCDLLLAVPKLGRVKVSKVFAEMKISPGKTFAGLSDRQRRELAGRLGDPRPWKARRIPRGPAQRGSALVLANEIRLERALVRRRVLAGHATVPGVLCESLPFMASLPIGELLVWQPRWGPNRSRRFLGRLMISELRLVGDLTARQRSLISERLA